MRNENGYNAIVKEAEKLGWPESYKNDLFGLDRAVLLEEADHHGSTYGKNYSLQFGWIVRVSGTHLLPLDSDYNGRPTLINYQNWLSGVLAFNSITQVELYWYDGTMLHRCETTAEFYELVEKGLASIKPLDISKFPRVLPNLSSRLNSQPSLFVGAIRASRNKAEEICNSVAEQKKGILEVHKVEGDLCTIYTSGNSTISMEGVRDFIHKNYHNLLFVY